MHEVITMNKEKQFPVPRKLRNTAKQSMLISGQPDFLYRYKEVKETFIIFDKKKKSIGNISDDIHLTLCDLAKGTNVKIIRETKTKRSPATSIEGFTSISIQKHKKDTMLIVPAADEAALIEKISKLKELLESNGAITQERCNWICIADKGKLQVSNEEIINKEQIVKTLNPKTEMSSHTKSLRDIALKSIKESKA